MKNSRFLMVPITIIFLGIATVTLSGCIPSKNSTDSAPSTQTTDVAEGDTFKLSVSPEYVYTPQLMKVKAGTKVRIEGDPKTLTGSMDTLIIDGYNLSKKIKEGDNVIEFTADKKGEFKVHCANGMGNGKLIVE